jgi:hypothetical protein
MHNAAVRPGDEGNASGTGHRGEREQEPYRYPAGAVENGRSDNAWTGG